jgi:hypothetical protein
VGVSGAGFRVRVGALARVAVVVVLRPLVLRRGRRPGMALPLVPGTVSGYTDATSDGIAG